MHNLGGLKQEKRRLLMKVVTSIAIYRTVIWVDVIDKRTYRVGIHAAYRRSTLSVNFAIRMVSTDVALVIAWMMPLKLIVDIDRQPL